MSEKLGKARLPSVRDKYEAKLEEKPQEVEKATKVELKVKKSK